MKRALNWRVPNIIAFVLALYFGRCTADLPEPAEPFVLCSEVP